MREMDKALIDTISNYKYVLNLPVIKLNQDTKQGMPKSGIFFTRLGSSNRGWSNRDYAELPVNPYNSMIERTHHIVTYRWSLLSNNAQEDIHRLKDLMQTLSFTSKLYDKYGIGTMYAGAVIQQVVINEANDYIDNPNFTIDYSVVSELVLAQPYTGATDVEIHRI